jgi:hypothetical protein
MAAIEFLNLKALLYVAFRFAPFILVSYFIVSSIFNADIRGIVFLGMLLLNCVITISVGNMLSDMPFMMVSPATRNKYGTCNTMNLTSGGPLSRVLPLNINVFAFTFGYLANLLDTPDNKQLVIRNIPMIIVFSVIIIAQFIWSLSNGCASVGGLLLSLGMGFGLGWGFSKAIVQSGISDLQFFNGIKNEEVCTKMSDELFNCTVENVLL